MLKPQQNVLYCFLGGLLAAYLMTIAKEAHYAVPDWVESGLPAGITAAIAYGHDLFMAYLQSKKIQVSNENPGPSVR